MVMEALQCQAVLSAVEIRPLTTLCPKNVQLQCVDVVCEAVSVSFGKNRNKHEIRNN